MVNTFNPQVYLHEFGISPQAPKRLLNITRLISQHRWLLVARIYRDCMDYIESKPYGDYTYKQLSQVLWVPLSSSTRDILTQADSLGIEESSEQLFTPDKKWCESMSIVELINTLVYDFPTCQQLTFFLVGDSVVASPLISHAWRQKPLEWVTTQ